MAFSRVNRECASLGKVTRHTPLAEEAAAAAAAESPLEAAAAAAAACRSKFNIEYINENTSILNTLKSHL